MLETLRRFLAWRRGRPVFRRGSIGFVEAAPDVLAFARGEGGERVFCVFNIGPRAAAVELPRGAGDVAHATVEAAAEAGVLTLPPWACVFLAAREG